MKKSIVFTLILLVLFAFVSCNSESDGIFRAVVNSSEKSEYVCKAYLGADAGTHYVFTAKGILSFKLNGSFKAINVSSVNTGNFTPVRGAYLDTNTDNLYGLDAYGNLFKVELANSNKITKLDGAYRILSKNGHALKVETDAQGAEITSIVHVDGSTVTGTSLVSKIYSSGDKDYFITANGMLDSTGNPIKYNGNATFNPSAVLCIIGDYAVVYSKESYEIHKIESNNIEGTSLGKLSSYPTAAFAYDDKIAFKTTVAFDIFDKTTKEVTANKKDSWARGIYTPTTEVSEFVKIDGYIYAINTSGGIIRIDVENGANESIFTN